MTTLADDKSLSRLLLEATWMQRLPDAVCDQVLSEVYESVHEAGETIARKGEPVNSWMGVGEGLLKVTGSFRSGKVVLFSGIPEGSWVGEGSVVKDEQRHYDVVAVRRSRVIHIPRSTFHWLMGISFEFNHFIVAHLNERLAQFMSMVETDRMADPIARVSRGIIGLYNPVLYPRMNKLLSMSQVELGELAGLTRQRTNYAIQELANQGLVEVRYGGLLVKDLPGLKERARSAEHAE